MAVKPIISPFIKETFWITSPWWIERNGEIHRGLDIATATSAGNVPVYSILEGTVIEAVGNQTTSKEGFGNYVIVKNMKTGYAYLFAHFHRIVVKVGDIVNIGELIGYEGNSGNSTGIHLHVEMQDMSNNSKWIYSYDKNNYLNPTEFMEIPNVINTECYYDGKIYISEVIKKHKFKWILFNKKRKL